MRKLSFLFTILCLTLLIGCKYDEPANPPVTPATTPEVKAEVPTAEVPTAAPVRVA